MNKSSMGIVAIAVCFAIIWIAPTSFAQNAGVPAVQDSGVIRIPAPWDRTAKLFPEHDYRPLAMGANSTNHASAQIGPVEFESRTSANDAPWRPYEAYFQQTHTAFSWSFGLHRSLSK
jgi:hypothetical protein